MMHFLSLNFQTVNWIPQVEDGFPWWSEFGLALVITVETFKH